MTTDNLNDIPPIVRAWVAQLCEPDMLEILQKMSHEQIDIKLSAARGKVRRKPIVVFNGGPNEFEAIE
jgi:DNA repair exonuclease SbcCD ATPase subunit